MMTEIINEKVDLLYDFCILRHRRGNKEDARENAVRQMLKKCGTETRMQIALHDVLMDKITLSELLQQKGMM